MLIGLERALTGACLNADAYASARVYVCCCIRASARMTIPHSATHRAAPWGLPLHHTAVPASVGPRTFGDVGVEGASTVLCGVTAVRLPLAPGLRHSTLHGSLRYTTQTISAVMVNPLRFHPDDGLQPGWQFISTALVVPNYGLPN